ncbi:MAG: hypothetical protein QG597_1021, partial [Actinomycetota bacterium]|nr:hypothetical protein [Actinomycetota bacterium]
LTGPVVVMCRDCAAIDADVERGSRG